MKNIILIGLPGSGKTTVGRLLAARLGKTFFDADEWLENWEQTTIRELFLRGEAVFREAEARTIVRLSSEDNVVIATGGGVVKKKRICCACSLQVRLFF